MVVKGTGDIRDPQTYAIIGAAMEVHRALGHGFLEAVYKEALAMELGARGIPFEREVMVTIYYKGSRWGARTRPILSRMVTSSWKRKQWRS